MRGCVGCVVYNASCRVLIVRGGFFLLIVFPPCRWRVSWTSNIHFRANRNELHYQVLTHVLEPWERDQSVDAWAGCSRQNHTSVCSQAGRGRLCVHDISLSLSLMLRFFFIYFLGALMGDPMHVFWWQLVWVSMQWRLLHVLWWSWPLILGGHDHPYHWFQPREPLLQEPPFHLLGRRWLW